MPYTPSRNWDIGRLDESQKDMDEQKAYLQGLKGQVQSGQLTKAQYNAEVEAAVARAGGYGINKTIGQSELGKFRDDSPEKSFGNEQAAAYAEAQKRYQAWAEGAQNREAYQAKFNSFGRNQQARALGLQRDAALGRTPSAAELLMQRGMEQSVNDQYALAASARGGLGGQALAMRSAQQGAAGLQQDYATQQAGLRAQEMAAARQAYMQGSTGLRDSDYQQTMAQAQLEMGQRQLNQQAMLGMTEFEAGARDTGLKGLQFDTNQANQYQMNRENWQSAERRARANTGDPFMGALEGGLGAASNFIPGAPAAKIAGGAAKGALKSTSGRKTSDDPGY